MHTNQDTRKHDYAASSFTEKKYVPRNFWLYKHIVLCLFRYICQETLNHIAGYSLGVLIWQIFSLVTHTAKRGQLVWEVDMFVSFVYPDQLLPHPWLTDIATE